MRLSVFAVLLGAVVLAAGCNSVRSDNSGQLQSYPSPVIEAAWVRNGEPIDYDGHKWFPVDDTENLLDTEVYQIGEYKNVQIFVDKVDTKPYNRIYTKFAKNKFRYYEQRRDD